MVALPGRPLLGRRGVLLKALRIALIVLGWIFVAWAVWALVNLVVLLNR